MADFAEASPMKIEIYKSSADGLWRWRAVARNGRIMADSGEGYASRRNACRAVNTFVQAMSRPFVKTVVFAHDERKRRWRIMKQKGEENG